MLYNPASYSSVSNANSTYYISSISIPNMPGHLLEVRLWILCYALFILKPKQQVILLSSELPPSSSEEALKDSHPQSPRVAVAPVI